METYDCLILGAGIAGITAGIYLKRGNYQALVLDKDAPGGKLNYIHRIDNYPGTPRISGPELAAQLYAQAAELNVTFDYGAVMEVSKEGDLFRVLTDVNEYRSKAIIVATGIENKKLGVPGEEKYNGKGVSYCATCDGNFFKGKPMVVYGYKDHAVEDAIYLSSLASTVYLLAPEALQTTEAHLSELQSLPNVSVIMDAKLLEAVGEERLTGVIYEVGGEKKTLEVAALFQLYGEKSSSMFLSPLGVNLNKGYIRVDAEMATNVPGLFACGDVVDKRLRQLVNAAGEGSVAATSAMMYCRSIK